MATNRLPKTGIPYADIDHFTPTCYNNYVEGMQLKSHIETYLPGQGLHPLNKVADSLAGQNCI
jgi:hypothetical protein